MRNVSMTTLRSCIMGMQSCSRQLRSPSFASFSMRTWWTCRVGVGLLISPLSYIYYFYTDLGCTFPTLTPIISSISALAQKWNKNAGPKLLDTLYSLHCIFSPSVRRRPRQCPPPAPATAPGRGHRSPAAAPPPQWSRWTGTWHVWDTWGRHACQCGSPGGRRWAPGSWRGSSWSRSITWSLAGQSRRKMRWNLETFPCKDILKSYTGKD